MSEAMTLNRQQAEPAAPARAAARPAGVVRIALLYAAVVAAALIARHFFAGGDYVGPDNDDVMRLVEVRDLLAGQGWFDMHQYRLGLPGGTLMHWSRFVDLPIAALIAFFSLFLQRETAEAAALVVWPSLTIVPVFIGMGLAGFRLSGRVGAHVAIGLSALYVVCINRFQPGAIDHHNVQMALMALMAAMLIDVTYSARSFGFAGFLAGAAIAVGAETTPCVAACCAIVAVLWAWEGAPMARAARAFALGLAATLTVAFFSTTPPALYSTVRCDQLSVGFYALGTIGGGLLFAATTAASSRTRGVRFGALALCGTAIAALVLILTPQCLRGPYANLDPLLVRIWLDNVSETRSVLFSLRHEPFSAGAFYAVPLLALGVCVWRILKGKRRQAHAILLALLLVAYAITLVQVRGAMFSSLFAFIPLAGLICELRTRSAADTRNVKAAALFVAFTLASAPAAWAFVGGLGKLALDGPRTAGEPASGDGRTCKTQTAMAPLAKQPPGLVAGPSNLGVGVLRYTDQRVLSAPYHRDPDGMLAALRIEMAPPAEAEAYLRRTGTTIFAFCPSDPETPTVKRAAPDGLLAAVADGRVPAYLEPLPQTMGKPLELYRVVAAK